MRIPATSVNPFYAAKPPVFAARPQITHWPVPGSDTTTFGKKKPNNQSRIVRIPEKPELHLIPWHSPEKVKVLSITTEKPDVFRIVLDVTNTKLVDAEGNPRIWPGQHLRIKADVPDTDEHRYLEALQYTNVMPNKAPVTDNAHRRYLNTRRFSVADVEKRADGAVAVSLIIRRVEYEQGGETRRGLVSNQLAAKKPDELVKISGPDKNHFLLPRRRDNMLVFSTGIASQGPIEYMIRTRLENQRGRLGHTRMYTGYRTRNDELCRDRYLDYAKNRSKRFSYEAAYSREAVNPEHIQDLMQRDADEILDLLMRENTYVYLCGVRDVETSVEEQLLALADARGMKDAVAARIAAMKATGQWRVEGVRSPLAKK